MKKYSDTFCVYPWVHQQATPPGKVNFCCISMHSFVTDNSGRAMTLDKDSFQEAWNVDYMKSLRKKMINGESIQGCQTCYKQEAVGKRSYRQSHNAEWADRIGKAALEDIVDASIKEDFVVATPPRCLDLRLGNLCNLKCRMCNPYNSVQIYKEWEDLDAQSNKRYSEFWKKYGLEFGGCSRWYESENFWSGATEAIPYLEKVYINGGEPTLIEGNYTFLNKCKDMGYAKKIDLFFNTNFTQIRDGFIELLNDFKSVRINASFDGIAEINDYIRAPSHWKSVDKNFREMASKGAGSLVLGISPVVQNYNILNITELLEYAECVAEEYNREISVDVLFCFNPKFLDIAFLPDKIKDMALERLNKFKKYSKTYCKETELSFYMKNSIDSLVNRLEQTMGQENSGMIYDFIRYTKTLDKQRGQNFEKYCPELLELLKKSNYDFSSIDELTAP